MAANPPLVVLHNTQHCPAPYAGEMIGLSRPGIDFAVTGVRTASGKWSARGTVFLTNMRLVFVADRPDAKSGLHAWELPLAYIWTESFNQPILGANNLRGKCWLVESGIGGQSVEWTCYFKEGGCGTFIPLFFRDITYIRSIAQRQQQAGVAAPPPNPGAGPSFSSSLSQALVDPNDPTVIYLTQPVGEGQQLGEAPAWAQGPASAPPGAGTAKV